MTGRRTGRWSALTVVLTAGCDGAVDPDLVGPELDPLEAFAGGEGTVFDEGRDAFSHPLSLLDRDGERSFFKGQALFRDAWVVAPSSTDSRDGLGPVFNTRACVDCHPRDGRGRPPEEGEPLEQLLLRVSIPGEDEHGGPRPEPTYGEQIQPLGIPGVPGEGRPRVHYEVVSGEYGDGERYELRRPEFDLRELGHGSMVEGAVVSPRLPRRLIGLGLLEALPEPTDGAVNEVWDVQAERMAMGRIGWKAGQPSVRQQTAKAFMIDIGMTSSMFPRDDCPRDDCRSARDGGDPELLDALLENVAFYAATLAVPARRDVDDPEVLRGRALFYEAGCVDCHVPRHVTEEHPTIGGLAGQTIWPYTDLRLHDLGDDLADDRPVYRAGGRQWRTPPLWGIGLVEVVNGHLFLLHDGRARGFAEAILWHGGEALPAREAFRTAPSDGRDALISFLESL